MRSLARALVLAAAGLLVGAVATVAWYWRAPAFVLNLQRDLPPNLTGVYPVERAAGTPFAWTSPRVALALPGADRRVPWQCTVRARGARPPAVLPADVTIAVDGVSLVHRRLASDVAEDVTVAIPPQPAGGGLTLTLAVSPPFQPGAADRRQLGIEITGLACRPEGAARAPARAWMAGATVTAMLGGALGLSGLPFAGAAALVLTLGIAAGLGLAAGAGPYSAFPAAVVGVGGWTAAVLVAATAAPRMVRRPLSSAARVAVALSATLFAIEAFALLHPSKAGVDALFHAHRLEWVVQGRLLFTQPMPSGVRFPYAIALYIVAAPWTLVATNHVALLKIVVLVSRAVAGLVLYPVVTRAWQDRAAGLVAIVLVHAVPLPFVVIGNANLTYAFGQSVAVMTIAAAVIVGLGATGWRGALLLWALASLAFLSHVGLFPVLGALLLAAAAGYAALGRPGLGRAAAIVAAATLLAAVFSVVVYYGHFGEAYRTLRQVRAAPATEAPAPGTAAPPPPRGAAYTLGERAESASRLVVRSFGWPVLLLAAAGLGVCVRAGWRDPLGIAIAATLGAAAAFEAGSVLAPVAPSFWRYAAEFISRVNYAAVPAVVILAGRAVSAGWTRGGPARVAVGAALALAVAQGTAHWLRWLF